VFQRPGKQDAPAQFAQARESGCIGVEHSADGIQCRQLTGFFSNPDDIPQQSEEPYLNH
jgi:hypothetical protein